MPDRKPLISGNWKMHLNHFEAIQTVQKLAYLIGARRRASAVDVSIHPPFTDIRSVQTLIESDRIPIAARAPSTATGRTRAPSPARWRRRSSPSSSVTLVIAGHSERRELFGETDEMVNRKVKAILANGMTPILCVGETLDEREAGATEAKVLGQIEADLAGVSNEQVGAHGHRLRADLGHRHRSHRHGRRRAGHVRRPSAQRWRSGVGADAAASLRVQYGGSVKASNIAELMAQDDIDGALVGGASLDPDEFARIVQYHLNG